MDKSTIVSADHRHVWHPYQPMDRWLAEPDPLVVTGARGSWLQTIDGETLLDGNSSWWVASLGHSHPRLLEVLRQQAGTLDHCAFGGITHENGALLAEELCALAPRGDGKNPLTRVFYTDNGSTAIEAAVKMSVQAWNQWGQSKKTRFVTLEGAFHGDSVGAASVGGVDVFRRPFAGILFDCVAVPSPALGGHAAAFEAMQRAIAGAADTLAAVVVEPMVQGAAGMQMYSADYLRALRECCDRHDVLLIIDEVFAGYGRTGPMWASDHAGITADLMCIGKAFASILPMAATMTTERIFDAFRGDSSRAFYYGHTFCGHPIGAALAREVLRIYREEDILGQVARKSERIARTVERLGQKPGVRRPRHLGMIGAVDLGEGGYLGETGVRFFKAARANGAYLRPMGDCVYICPPLNIADGDLDRLCDIFEASVDTALA